MEASRASLQRAHCQHSLFWASCRHQIHTKQADTTNAQLAQPARRAQRYKPCELQADSQSDT